MCVVLFPTLISSGCGDSLLCTSKTLCVSNCVRTCMHAPQCTNLNFTLCEHFFNFLCRAKVTLENKNGHTALEVARYWGDDLIYAVLYAKCQTLPQSVDKKGERFERFEISTTAVSLFHCEDTTCSLISPNGFHKPFFKLCLMYCMPRSFRGIAVAKQHIAPAKVSSCEPDCFLCPLFE